MNRSLILITCIAVCAAFPGLGRAQSDAPYTEGQQGARSGSAPADIVYAQPGQLVDVGGVRLRDQRLGGAERAGGGARAEALV